MKYKIPYNYVAVRLTQAANRDIVLPDGTTFKVDNSFEPSDYVATSGTVVGVPDRLLYGRFEDIRYPGAMEWETEMEAELGDIVYFHKLEALNSLGCLANPILEYWEENPLYIVGNGYIDIFVPYSAIYGAERDGELVMFNGYTLVAPIPMDYSDVDIVLPDSMEKNEIHLGIFYAGGSSCKAHDGIIAMDSEGYEKGDIVVFRKFNNKIHDDIVKDKELFKIQRKEIIAKLNK